MDLHFGVKKVKVSHSLIAVGAEGVCMYVGGMYVSWAQLMKGGAHPSPFAALTFLVYFWFKRQELSIFWQYFGSSFNLFKKNP